MWYVVQDEEGSFLTETPAATDTILFQGNLADAEAELSRACNGWEDENEDMNEDFQ